MRIDSISIDNFRGIDHLDLTLDPRFTLLVGNNGAGKTSILSALSVALGIWHVSKIVTGPNQWRNIMDHEVREILRPTEGDRPQFESVGEVQVTATGSVGKRPSHSWTRAKRTRKSRTTDPWSVNTKADIVDACNARRAQKEPLPLLAYYGGGRAWMPSNERAIASLTGDLRDRLEDGYYDCLNERIRLKDILKWFVLEAATRDENGKFRPGFETVRLALSRGIMGVDNVYYDLNKKELVISIDNVAQPFSNLSDGQRTMAATVADLAIRAVTLNSYLFGNGNGEGYASPEIILEETPGVVLIDEVDVHLHPIWQRSVVKDLETTFPKIQFVCSTHSAQVAGEVDGKSLRIFNPKNGKWETPSQSYGMDSNWILQVLMHGSKMDPEIEMKIKTIQQHASKQEISDARRILAGLRERVGNSEEIQFAASTIDRIELLGR